MTTSIVWFRRDVRLFDNPAWAHGTLSDRVIPLFVVDPSLYDVVSQRRRSLLVGGLRALDESLARRGGRLRVEHGDPETVVASAVREVDADTVHINREITPYGMARDERVARHVNLTRWEGHYLHPPGSLLTRKGTPFRVFTPFYEAWLARPVDPIPEEANTVVTEDQGVGIPEILCNYPAGEQRALARLESFAQHVDGYQELRNRPDLDRTSRLSIDFKYGWLGPRAVPEIIGLERRGANAFIRQFAWRDFYGHVLAAFPETVHESMRHEFRSLTWRHDQDDLAAWQTGNTGYPIIDAGIRQLVAEGWIHNRIRLLVASFLVKDLLIDWRIGERFFRRHLLDADVAQNVGNWQWVAGTGTDAAPYFRIFNPVTQSRRFDPAGEYIRRWVPELARLPDTLVHAPWAAPLEVAELGVELGVDYPQPVVDHSWARKRALVAYETARSRPS